jgi:hypothetical protein
MFADLQARNGAGVERPTLKLLLLHSPEAFDRGLSRHNSGRDACCQGSEEEGGGARGVGKSPPDEEDTGGNHQDDRGEAEEDLSEAEPRNGWRTDGDPSTRIRRETKVSLTRLGPGVPGCSMGR